MGRTKAGACIVCSSDARLGSTVGWAEGIALRADGGPAGPPQTERPPLCDGCKTTHAASLKSVQTAER